MLVCELDLGKTKDYYKFTKHLLEPPEGFESTHGVKSTSQKPSGRSSFHNPLLGGIF